MSGTVPIGAILAWTQEAGSVPSGWHVCDGAEGTRDLRDRFVVACGSVYPLGTTGSGGGAGSIPMHSHTMSGSVSQEVTYQGYIWPAHRHWGTVYTDVATPGPGNAGGGLIPTYASKAQAHVHGWNPQIWLEDNPPYGTNQPVHCHGIGGTLGEAEATASAASYPNWYALYYIQRLS